MYDLEIDSKKDSVKVSRITSLPGAKCKEFSRYSKIWKEKYAGGIGIRIARGYRGKSGQRIDRSEGSARGNQCLNTYLVHISN